ncbi:MAG: isoleucine--tRNA ligase [Alphaproteobacteria bacterium]|nr:isoleucine--tRNA ligase [Alphaproteobacteria bacterium]
MSSDSNNNADFYKETVFLPKTEFPMRGELPKKEPAILEKWNEMDLYKKQREHAKGRDKFILHDGPPYANGNIHIGHAMNKVLKDVIIKTMAMRGFDTPYVPGWDCHGLPIEWKVEEKYRNEGKDKNEVDPIQFREECRQFARKWVDIQAPQFQRLGISGDWKNPYLTMTNRAESLITKEIHKFLKNGGLYKGVKPVMWSVVEETALAEAEVEYKEHKSVTIWVKFPIIESNNALLKDAKIVIWTTTPWTMPSNRAVAFGKNIEYAVYTVEATEENSGAIVGEKLVLATTLAENVKTQAKIEEWSASEPFMGDTVEGTICAHPFRGQGYDFDVPALCGDFVTDESGTGFVHIAPGHGADDFELGKKHNIEITDNVTDDGKFRDHVPLFAGTEVYTQEGKLGGGNFVILKAMAEAGALLAKGSMRHEYPHSWRSKAPIIFRTTPQWFIGMDNDLGLRKTALKAIEETRWVPKQGKKRITAMVEGRPDWCISRQRAWGVPIAIFIDKDTNEPLKDEKILDKIITAFEDDGADAWWTEDNAFFFEGTDHDPAKYKKVFDIVDVWFESGSTHAFVVEDRPDLGQQADLYLEGSDQHRGWFQSSLLESCGTRGHAPYKTVLTHGFVLDEKGYKMSKSEGNVVDPKDVIDEFGADIVRLWASSSDYSNDIKIGKDTLKYSTDLYRRIRNTLRFLLGALEGFSEDEKVAYADMPELEQYMLHQLADTDSKINTEIDDYNFSPIMKIIHDFCNDELSSFYFDIRKDRLYCDRQDSVEWRACRTVMHEMFEWLVKRIAPVLSFTAEETWSYRPIQSNDESIHLTEVLEIPAEYTNTALAEKWTKIKDIREVVLGAIEPHRASKEIGSSLEASPVIYTECDYAGLIDDVLAAEVCITSQAMMVASDAPEDAFSLSSIKGVGVVFKKADGKKCQRCWKILPDVGSDPEYPDLSPRDADAVRWYTQNKKKVA